jgi:hypothetical protein
LTTGTISWGLIAATAASGQLWKRWLWERDDPEFKARVLRVIEEDRELLERLAK